MQVNANKEIISIEKSTANLDLARDSRDFKMQVNANKEIISIEKSTTNLDLARDSSVSCHV